MKLLLDQNLSFKLVSKLADVFPGSVHVRDVNLAAASDSEIWDYARVNDFLIASKDDDFRQMSILRGAPPKVVWLQVGNCSTGEIEQLLRSRYPAIRAFVEDEESSFLILPVAAA